MPFTLFLITKGMFDQYDLSLLTLTSIICLKQCLSAFSSVQLLIFFSPFLLSSLKGNHYEQPTFKEWGVMLHFLEGTISTQIIWDSSAWEICLFPHLPNHLFISVWTYRYLFYDAFPLFPTFILFN